MAYASEMLEERRRKRALYQQAIERKLNKDGSSRKKQPVQPKDKSIEDAVRSRKDPNQFGGI